MFGRSQEATYILVKKANSLVSRGNNYAFEHQINIQSYFSQLKDTAFLKSILRK